MQTFAKVMKGGLKTQWKVEEKVKNTPGNLYVNFKLWTYL